MALQDIAAVLHIYTVLRKWMQEVWETFGQKPALGAAPLRCASGVTDTGAIRGTVFSVNLSAATAKRPERKILAFHRFIRSFVSLRMTRK